ncbi:hypothetical protein ACFQZ4_13095 [Catellatospora coxensis]|uniref:Uncharacterized protein n=1 Tax=Catellatospora coxensis TaxID=310354 RepID=A0A8J3KXZ1_9ACTN|nr:hypothetical protein Cco03nite_49030 [Catellatospora coxensis]
MTAPACAVLPLTVLDPIEHWADTTSGNAARCGAALIPGAAGSAVATGSPVTATATGTASPHPRVTISATRI